MNKKGSLVDVAYIVIILLAFSLLILISSRVLGGFVSELKNVPGVAQEGIDAANNFEHQYNNTIDGAFLFLFAGIIIAMFVLAALVRVHPIFIPLFFIALIFVIFLCGIASNVYQEMAANTEMVSIAEDHIFMSHIMEFFPLIIGVVGFALMLVMYKLWSASQ